MKNNVSYNIDYISKRTGLSKLLIRTWENRYSILNPKRTVSNRRLYDKNDITKLLLINHALDLGYKIGDLKHYSIEDLQLIQQESKKNNLLYSVDNGNEFPQLIAKSMELIVNYDKHGLEKLIQNALINYSKISVISDFILPLAAKIGYDWQNGNIRISQEHFATALIKETLTRLVEQNINHELLIFCTPIGQKHEIGILAMSVIASMRGYNVLYLGTEIPAVEIIQLMDQFNAFGLVMSIVFPENDPKLTEDLLIIAKELRDRYILIGGNSAESYMNSEFSDLVVHINNINDYINHLDRMK